MTIWNEGRHEKLHPDIAAIYPSGIHGAIAAGLKNEGFAMRCASLDDPDEGLGEQLLDLDPFAHQKASQAIVGKTNLVLPGSFVNKPSFFCFGVFSYQAMYPLHIAPSGAVFAWGNTFIEWSEFKRSFSLS